MYERPNEFSITGMKKAKMGFMSMERQNYLGVSTAYGRESLCVVTTKGVSNPA